MHHNSAISLIGVPTDIGAGRLGAAMGPDALRVAQLGPALARLGCIPADSLPAWNEVIGLRNRIVHDYMNVDMEKIFAFLRAHGERPVLDFLLAPLPHEPGVR